MILVDPVKKYETNLRFKQWSHMVSTVGPDELHEMADKLALKREWWQPGSFSHYDVTPSKRRLAIVYGARQVSSGGLLFCNYDYANKRQVRPCAQCAAILGESAAPGKHMVGCVKCDIARYLSF